MSEEECGQEGSDAEDACFQMPHTVIELIPKRLYMGPMPSRKNKVDVYGLVRGYGISNFINCMPNPKLYYWEKPLKPFGPNVSAYQLKRYRHSYYVWQNSRPDTFPVTRDGPPKDAKLFKFLCAESARMKADKNRRVYVYDGSGAYAAGLIALCLWYFLQSPEQKEAGFDPVQLMRSQGKHHVVPEREKHFIQAIRRMCEKDKLSIHRHLFFGAPPKKKKKVVDVEEVREADE